MKKNIVLLILSAYALIGCSSDFRNVDWGMSAEEVKTHERARFIEDGRSEEKNSYWLVYEASLQGQLYELTYIFIDGQLEQAIYSKRFSAQEDKCGPVITTFVDELTRRHGEPYRNYVTPEGIDEKSATCRDLIERNYSRLTVWDSKNRHMYGAIGSGDDSEQVLLIDYIIAPE